jgi:uncharacterized protein YggE
MLRPALAAAVLALAAASAQAAPSIAASEATPPTVTVAGEGHAGAAPDLAVLESAVVTTAVDPGEALSQNSARMRTVTAAFRAAGIAERDIATSQFTLTPDYAREEAAHGGAHPPRITGYTVRNEVTVKVRDLGKLGQIMTVAVGQGANAVGSLSFTLAHPERVLDAARRDAVADARRRAALYADALGMTLGPLVEIHEGDNAAPPMPRYRAGMLAAAAPVPVSPGEREVTATVGAVWRLAPR